MDGFGHFAGYELMREEIESTVVRIGRYLLTRRSTNYRYLYCSTVGLPAWYVPVHYCTYVYSPGQWVGMTDTDCRLGIEGQTRQTSHFRRFGKFFLRLSPLASAPARAP